MMQRIRKTRAGRKLLANRMALGAMLIIGVYLAAAIFVMLGGISPSFCNQPVGPPTIPGFFAEAPAEKRLVNAENTLAVVDRALAKSTPESQQASLDEIQVGLRKLEKISLDDFELKLEKAYAIYDDLSASPDLENDESGLALLADLESEVESLTATPTFSQQVMETIYLSLGTDRQGRSIFIRAVFSIKVAVQIGVVTAMISVAIGSVLGALAGFFGGWVDHAVIWLYSPSRRFPTWFFW